MSPTRLAPASARTLTCQALLVAATEVSGAVIAGGDVTETIRSGIVSSGCPSTRLHEHHASRALSAAALSGCCLLTVRYPVSTTPIIGGIVGAAIALGMVSGPGRRRTQDGPVGSIGQIVVSWARRCWAAWCRGPALRRHQTAHSKRANEQAERRLTLKKERIAHRERHKAAFDRLTGGPADVGTKARRGDAVAAKPQGL